MREILLTNGNGLIAYIDDEDYDRVSRYKWHCKDYNGGKYYARTTLNGKNVLLHHFLIGRPPKGLETDHIDGDIFNYSKANLRFCTHAQNMKNHKQVSISMTRRYKWRAQICVDYKVIQLGEFDTAKEALLAYKLAARTYYGEYARDQGGC